MFFFVVVVSITLSCIDTGHVSENTLKVEGLVSLYHFKIRENINRIIY